MWYLSLCSQKENSTIFETEITCFLLNKITMLIKGGILKSIHENIEYEAVDISPQDEEVIVDIKASALNRRDLWIQEGKYAKIKLPCILGSDGAGEYHGEKVVIYPAFRWGIDPTHQSNEFEVLGMPHHGCFADKVAIPPSNLFAIPSHLTFTEAAAFPLAGLTAWRALMTQGKAQKGQNSYIRYWWWCGELCTPICNSE
jgi:NADPH:quinone reductase-like Zn-dependent oxidoreductase